MKVIPVKGISIRTKNLNITKALIIILKTIIFVVFFKKILMFNNF